ncbi:MAG: glycosyltransferase [Lachnospiraceae bacterium]|nr:glycosyltransferase [Lachnospiraceae bacterium]
MISVITPVYKVEKYLQKCVDSILNQSFSDFELIIVDDGSPDSCGVIADDYATKDNRVRVIHKINGGAANARNAGIAEAKGDYLYFPDSDDWLESTYLEELYHTARETGAQLVISGFKMEYYESGTFQTYAVSMPVENYETQTMVRKNLHQYFNNMMMAVPWNKLYSTGYIKEKGLLFPDIKWDDLHFNMEVIMDIEKVAISNTTGYHFFRSREGSETTMVFDGLLYKKRREQFEHILRVYEYWNIDDEQILSVIYGYYKARLVQCIQEISISDSSDKKGLILEVLNDDLTATAIKRGVVDSRILNVAAIPMRFKNVTICLVFGKIMGYVKKNMSAVFYGIKSHSVNKAKNV